MTDFSNDEYTTSDFDLIDFIERGTIARRDVPIYLDHEAYAKVTDLYGQLRELDEDWDADAERSIGESSERAVQVDALNTELSEWEERLHNSRMIWTVRAVSQDEVDEALKHSPDPKPIAQPKDNAPQKVHDAWTEKVQAWAEKQIKAERERRLWLIAKATVSIETKAGTRDGVSLDELRKIVARPHGAQWAEYLNKAITEASREEARPPVPTLPGDSGSIRA